MDQPDTQIIDGIEYPRVSRILDFLPDPPALAHWKATASDEKRAAAKLKGEQSAAVGTEVHRLISENEPPSEELTGYVAAQKNWIYEEGVEIIKTEEKVWSVQFRYCGTMDALVKIGGLYYIVDYKTGKKSGKHKNQGAAYRVAAGERFGIDIAGVRMVYLTSKGRYTQYIFYDTSISFLNFVTAIKLYEKRML